MASLSHVLKQRGIRAYSNQVITTNPSLLNVSVVDDWGWSSGLDRFVTSAVGDYGLGIMAASNLTILSDVRVT